MGKDVRMVTVTPEPIDEVAVGLDAAWALGPDTFLVEPRDGEPCSFADQIDWVGRRALVAIDIEDVYAADSGFAYTIEVTGRFYGIDYERGRFAQIDAVASWFEARLPDCVVYYGSDDYSYPLAPWRESRDELRARWMRVGMRPYYDLGFDSASDEATR